MTQPWSAGARGWYRWSAAGRFPGPIACAGPAACYAVGDNGTILAVNTAPGPANCTEPGKRSSSVSLGRRPAG